MNKKSNHKLPRSVNGVRLPKHPLVMMTDMQREHGAALTDIARAMNMKQVQQLWREVNYASKDRDHLIPAHWILDVCRLSGMPPVVFRPDLYRPEWTWPDKPEIVKVQ